MYKFTARLPDFSQVPLRGSPLRDPTMSPRPLLHRLPEIAEPQCHVYSYKTQYRLRLQQKDTA